MSDIRLKACRFDTMCEGRLAINRYSVWDNLRGRIALADNRECANLGFDEALDTADPSTARTSSRERSRLPQLATGSPIPRPVS